MPVYVKMIMLKRFYLALCLSLLPTAYCVAEEKAPEKFKFTVNKFSVEGESIASILSDDEVATYLKPFQAKSYDLKELQDLGKGLEAMIREEGFAFYRVILPPQSLNSGEVKLKVISFRVGNINVEGNNHFSTYGVLSSVPELQRDVSPNTHDLAASVKVANKHPS